MTNEEWNRATTDQKLDWLRDMALDRLNQCNNIARHTSNASGQMALQLDEVRRAVEALEGRVQDLEEARPNPED